MPKPKKKKNYYVFYEKRHPTFTSAAGAAVDMALKTGDTESIAEHSSDGTLVGYLHVTCKGEVV